MKISNINSNHVYWIFVSTFILLCIYWIWAERMRSLFLIIPSFVIIGAWKFAWRWEQKQKNRLIARCQARKMLLWFFFLLTIIEIIATACFPGQKMEQGATAVFVALIFAGQDYKRYSRWVEKKPASISN
jgi:hypothetical protein